MQQLKDQGSKAIFPDIKQAVAEFEALIVWTTGSNGEKLPEPYEGFDQDYDNAKKRVEMVEQKFEKHLQDVKEMFGFRGSREIKYAHSVHQVSL